MEYGVEITQSRRRLRKFNLKGSPKKKQRRMNFIKMELSLQTLSNSLEKDMKNSRLENNKMLQNITDIFLRKLREEKKQVMEKTLDKSSTLNLKIEFNAQNAKRLDIPNLKEIF
jgi:hypothetical protein